MLQQLSFIYFTAVLRFTLEQTWCSEVQSSFWKMLTILGTHTHHTPKPHWL